MGSLIIISVIILGFLNNDIRFFYVASVNAIVLSIIDSIKESVLYKYDMKRLDNKSIKLSRSNKPNNDLTNL